MEQQPSGGPPLDLDSLLMACLSNNTEVSLNKIIMFDVVIPSVCLPRWRPVGVGSAKLRHTAFLAVIYAADDFIYVYRANGSFLADGVGYIVLAWRSDAVYWALLNALLRPMVAMKQIVNLFFSGSSFFPASPCHRRLFGTHP